MAELCLYFYHFSTSLNTPIGKWLGYHAGVSAGPSGMLMVWDSYSWHYESVTQTLPHFIKHTPVPGSWNSLHGHSTDISWRLHLGNFFAQRVAGCWGNYSLGIIWMKNCQQPEPPSYIPWCPIVFLADGVSSPSCFRAQAHGHPSRKSKKIQQMPCKPLVWSKHHLRLMPHRFDSWKPGSSRSTKFDIVRLCSTCIFCMIALTLWIERHRIQCIP